MGYASMMGRARVNPNAPEAAGVCDRCGQWYSLRDLVFQMEWRGNALTDIRLRVCKRTCLDIPFELDRPLMLPPDPPPVDQPRPETFAIDEKEGSEVWDNPDLFWDGGENWL